MLFSMMNCFEIIIVYEINLFVIHKVLKALHIKYSILYESSTTTAGHTLFVYPRCCEYS
jgi:hypothetical protein